MLCFAQHDDEDQHSDRLVSTFYSDVFSLNLGTSVWSPVLLGKALQPDEIESSEDEEEGEQEGDEDEDEDEGGDCDAEKSVEPEPEPEPKAQMTAEAAAKAEQSSAAGEECDSAPSPRIGAGVVALQGEGDTAAILVFGGMRENAKGVEEPSNDMWRLGVGVNAGGWERLC